MHSIRSKITIVSAGAVVITMLVAAILGVVAIRNVGNSSARQSLQLLCEVGQKNLDTYFTEVEQSVEAVVAYVESDLDGLDDESLQAHLDRANDFFARMAYKTKSVLTYYYRIDPEVSKSVEGFWFVSRDGKGFVEHEVTDITEYDTSDTSALMWFTVPKKTGSPIWLAPYVTENLNERVVSYNVPIYFEGRFVGVVGIEIDYSTMAEQVDNITLYDSGYAFIIGTEGDMVYHPHLDVIDVPAEDLPRVPEGLLGSNSFVRYTYEGAQKAAVWMPLSNGMRLVVTVPVAEINASWQRWAVGVTAVFAALIVVFVALILRVADKIIRPLEELTEAAEKVNAGDYDVVLSYDHEDEIGVLTRAFERLITNIRTYISDLSDLAYADALTSVRNKGAFSTYLRGMQVELEESQGSAEFAVCMFDCNNLKSINDRFGHDKGDIYLKLACNAICTVFDHSPVFRIGGDEFAAILQGEDYQNRDMLVRLFDEACANTRCADRDRWEQISVARGLATYDAALDSTVDDTLRRADRSMYQHKSMQKTARMREMGTNLQ